MSTAIASIDLPSKRNARIQQLDLIVTPIFFSLLAILLTVVWIYSDFDRTTASILEPSRLWSQFQQQIYLALWSTALVIVVAIPLGILVTREGAPRLKNNLVSMLGLGQAIPAYGLIVLFFVAFGQGTVTVVLALATFALLPVLRNTIVGLEQVDQSVIEAGKGMGLTSVQRLKKIELPLAVPVIMAGIRTATVINVGMATLAYLIGGGGLGETIAAGLKNGRPTAIFVGAVLVALIALVLDFLGGLAQRYLRPKGLA
ncbi:MAG: ABC transporter permease [Candidatus Nanopelagicales bacterium]|nr:ABC transporter permease [Candidatus Nanopelagicales bacterium]MCF8540103.1 ABC transporter permease [Candidatus Nanopelagicales bacterium]MCF8551828.1 ABC transporter permease [Candidatus Nanopelagicales bacterium]